MACITAGLLPDGHEAAIVPFNNRSAGTKEATLIPMIEGRLKLARRATAGLSLRVRVVYACDAWEYEDGLSPVLKHTPKDGDKRDESIVAAYAVANLPASIDPEFEVFSKADIDRFRGYSRGQGGPWKTHYPEMAKKAVLGQLLKRLPKAVGAPPEPPRQFEGMELDPGSVVDGLAFDPTVGVAQEYVNATAGGGDDYGTVTEQGMRNTLERDEAVAARSSATVEDGVMTGVTVSSAGGGYKEPVDQSTGEIQGGPASSPEAPPPLDDDDSPF